MLGEHIRTLRGGHWNHAIDCGDETVIHLAEDAPGPGRIRRSYRPEFVAGAEAVEVVTHRERTFPADEVVARAYSRIAHPALAAMFPDSAAFAQWCTCGRLPAERPNLALSILAVNPEPTAPGTAPAKLTGGTTPAPPKRKKPASRKAAARRIVARPAARTRAVARPLKRKARAVAEGKPKAKRKPAKKVAPRGGGRAKKRR